MINHRDIMTEWRRHANETFDHPNTSTERTLAARVLTLMAQLEDQEEKPQVVWTLDIDEARALYDYLHHNRPGGHQFVHDSLLEAISEAAHGQ